MKRLLTIAVAVLFCVAISTAGAVTGTLYDREVVGTPDDAYPAINGSGGAPGTNPSSTNWKHQYGGTTSWSGVYDWGEGWAEEEGGETDIDIEADIEMYCETSITDPLLYFHFGNLKTLTQAQRQATVSGTMWANHGMFVGISFYTTDKVEADFHLDTGIIDDAMQGIVDVKGNPLADAFDVKILMNWGKGLGYQLPTSFGAGSHGTQPACLWWNQYAPNAGAYNLTWLIELIPDEFQADGEYSLDPTVCAAPAL